MPDISGIISNISILVASVIGVYGVRSWQIETRGRRRLEIAEETLISFYQVRDAIVAIRSPMGYVGEGKSRQPEEGETPEQARARDNLSTRAIDCKGIESIRPLFIYF